MTSCTTHCLYITWPVEDLDVARHSFSVSRWYFGPSSPLQATLKTASSISARYFESFIQTLINLTSSNLHLQFIYHYLLSYLSILLNLKSNLLYLNINSSPYNLVIGFFSCQLQCTVYKKY